MNFILNKNKVVVGRFGRAIRFAKDQPTHVPKSMWADVQAVGAVPETEIPEDPVEAAIPKAPKDPDARKTAVFAAFEKIVLKNDRADFTGAGAPRDKALEAVLGFKIDAKDRDVLWVEFRQADKEE